MEKVDYIVVEASYAGLELISNFIQKKCILTNLSFKKSWELMLTVDEICSAIVNCKINEPNIIKVLWKDMGNVIKIEIMDDGTPFNPLNYDMKDSDYGIGFHIIKEMVDYVEYKRENGFNIVTLKKFRKKCKK
ncbi:MAG: ATP-binding protein [Candidatus Omnitrophica bacterium]|nr:ATP-binding protein [Candidatus Omnitrophota bacterium]MCM8806724.1 ATP-binding protein [Candidatus Omnitrophota bacterium]